MMKVLVPVDGSDNSLRAAQYVLKMTLNHPSVEVTLLTVACNFIGAVYAEIYVDNQQVMRTCLEAAKMDLEKVKKIFDGAGVKVNTEILTGDPGNVIVDYARDKGVDKVVMGSRGLNPILGTVLGSVTYKVLHGVKVPVTVVK